MSDIKNRKVNLGIILILVGVLWILSNFNIIDINLYSILNHMVRGIFDLWPLILVIIGIGIIFKNELLNTGLWILFLLILVIYSLFVKDNILKNNSQKPFKAEVYTSKMREDIQRGNLDLEVGATSFNIYGLDNDFARFEHDGAFKYKFTNKKSIENLYISNKNNSFINNKSRSFNLGLNSNIPWNLNMDIGAISGNLNLSDIMISKVDLDMGAGNLEMTLGKRNDFTSVDIDAGASKIAIYIPKESGVKIDLEGALNSTNLNDLGLVKSSSGEFISENYDKATNKYEMDIDMGVGSFELNYYEE